MIKPLDTHAHIEPEIGAQELERLDSCVVAVTRTMEEHDLVVHRRDAAVMWGVGVHPGLAGALRSFDRAGFQARVEKAVVVGEVGLDGGSRVPMEQQEQVLSAIFSVVSESPRIVSVHSYRATDRVLRLLEEHGARGVILHWWLGDEAQTRRATELGAYFSVNASQVSRWKPISVVPSDRLLPETDHPFGDRREGRARRPGNVALVEASLGSHLSLSPEDTRSLLWRNFRGLVDQVALFDRLPRRFQVQLLAA